VPKASWEGTLLFIQLLPTTTRPPRWSWPGPWALGRAGHRGVRPSLPPCSCAAHTWGAWHSSAARLGKGCCCAAWLGAGLAQVPVSALWAARLRVSSSVRPLCLGTLIPSILSSGDELPHGMRVRLIQVVGLFERKRVYGIAHKAGRPNSSKNDYAWPRSCILYSRQSSAPLAVKPSGLCCSGVQQCPAGPSASKQSGPAGWAMGRHGNLPPADRFIMCAPWITPALLSPVARWSQTSLNVY